MLSQLMLGRGGEIFPGRRKGAGKKPGLLVQKRLHLTVRRPGGPGKGGRVVCAGRELWGNAAGISGCALSTQ